MTKPSDRFCKNSGTVGTTPKTVIQMAYYYDSENNWTVAYNDANPQGNQVLQLTSEKTQEAMKIIRMMLQQISK